MKPKNKAMTQNQPQVSDCCGALFSLKPNPRFKRTDRVCDECGKNCNPISPQQKEQGECGMCGHDENKGCGCPCHKKKEVCGKIIHVGFEGATTCANKKGDCIMHDYKFCANTECEWDEGNMKSVAGGHMHRRKAVGKVSECQKCHQKSETVDLEIWCPFCEPQEAGEEIDTMVRDFSMAGKPSKSEIRKRLLAFQAEAWRKGQEYMRQYLIEESTDRVKMHERQAITDTLGKLKEEIEKIPAAWHEEVRDGEAMVELKDVIRFISNFQEDNTKPKA